MNKEKICYCWIKPEYLQSIFDQKTLDERKYAKRPFIFFPDQNMAIAIPEITVHNDRRYKLNYYFNDEKFYLNVENYFYVPECEIIFNEKWAKRKEKYIL